MRLPACVGDSEVFSKSDYLFLDTLTLQVHFFVIVISSFRGDLGDVLARGNTGAMAVQVATAAAACTPSTRPYFTCTQSVGNNILDWRAIPGGVQMAVSAPGSVWVGLMVPDVPGKMSTNDPNDTPALDSPRPSFAAIGSSLATGNVYSVRSALHEVQTSAFPLHCCSFCTQCFHQNAEIHLLHMQAFCICRR